MDMNQSYWTEMQTSINTTRLLKVEIYVAPWGHMTEMFLVFKNNEIFYTTL